ncbi:MAG: hypothetical protein K2M60_07250 [Lachnospiraceae bacterium]|nr:hypothetical protein [Lachnospiraceae bacterium]MDE6251563.1 hypothetical protein [Lachnospiraceae bacterium]
MWLIKLKYNIYDRLLRNNNSGMGVVEIILIILVLMGLVLLFKTNINKVITSVFTKINNQLGSF